MAATDLCSEIEKGVVLSAVLEKSICRAYMAQLSDTSLNVQGNAVKCISRIGSKISESQFGEITNKLTECIIKGTEQLCDIYGTCLKTLINEADETFGKTLCNCLLPPLIRGTGQKLDTVREQCIELTNEVLKRFTSVLATNPAPLTKDTLVDNLISQLSLQKPGLRKRACACLGSLAVLLNATQINHVVLTLLKNISKDKPSVAYTYIEGIGAIASTVGYKLAPHVSEIVKSFTQFCLPLEGMDAATAEQDFSIKDVCLTVFESMVKKCPKEITQHLDTLISMVMSLMGYDPNYNPDVMIEGDEGVNFEEWGGVEEEQIEDDASWKVRRATIRLLDTLIKYRYDKIKADFDKILAKIIERLSEREDTIKCLLLETFTDLIKGMIVGTITSNDALESTMKLERKSSAEYLLKGVPNAITKIVAHYNDKSMKVREAIASVMLNMALVIPDYMNGVLLGTVLPQLFLNFKENSSTTKITVFQTLRRLMLTTMSVDGYVTYFSKILDIIGMAMKEDYFKLSAEALATAGVLIKLLMREDPPLKEAKDALLSIHKLCVDVLKHSDVDQEIKQAAIYASGIITANSAGILAQKDLDELLGILHDRMKYEPLRLASLKAFNDMVSSNRKPTIEKGLEEALPEIIHMLKKVVRQVKLVALEIILGVCNKYPMLTKKFATDITENTLQIFREGDLQLIQLTLKILVNTTPFASDKSLDNLLRTLMELCGSSLFQTVIEDAIPLLSTIAKKNKGNLTEVKITEELWNIANEKNYKAISAAIAPILSERPEVIDESIDKYINILSNPKEDELRRKISALILGCLGRHKDLSKHPLGDLLFSMLKGKEDNIKISAAICLGNIALGNGTYYIPLILAKLKDATELSYLMLLAIREIVVQDEQHAMVKKLATEVIPALKSQADTNDEGDRTIIAEIIGRLYLIDPLLISNEIEQGLSNTKENVQATFALSFKYLLQKGDKDQFTKLLPRLLALIGHKSLLVQKALLDSLTNIARQNAVLLRPYTKEIQTAAISLTTMRPELIKIVDLGPLQHRIDEGQPTRKGAYTLLENMIEGLHDKMDIGLILDKAIEGLNDDFDEVQNTCQQILIKLCDIAPESVLGPLEKLMECVSNAIDKGMERLKKMQNAERTIDTIRGFLRVVVAISRLPEMDLNQKYQDVMNKLMKDKTIQSLYDEINKIAKS